MQEDRRKGAQFKFLVGVHKNLTIVGTSAPHFAPEFEAGQSFCVYKTFYNGSVSELTTIILTKQKRTQNSSFCCETQILYIINE